MLSRRLQARTPSLLALSEWQEKERSLQLQSAVDEDGDLLDNLTLELRVHPPSIEVDNFGHDKFTVVTIDSANRPGSLIYVSWAAWRGEHCLGRHWQPHVCCGPQPSVPLVGPEAWVAPNRGGDGPLRDPGPQGRPGANGRRGSGHTRGAQQP